MTCHQALHSQETGGIVFWLTGGNHDNSFHQVRYIMKTSHIQPNTYAILKDNNLIMEHLIENISLNHKYN